MVSVRDFFDNLSGVQRDMFISVATDLQASAPPDKLKRLTKFHNDLKDEIDRINGRREALGQVLNNIETLLKYLSQYTKGKGESFEVALFRNNLQKFAADLRSEIAANRPDKKLAKKFDVARKIESILQRQSISAHLFTDIFGGDTQPVKPTPEIDNGGEGLVELEEDEPAED